MATVTFPEIHNNGITTLNGAITDSATTIVLATGGASALGLDNSTTDAYLTIIDPTTWRKNPLTSPETLEIVQVTAVSTDTLTVTRGVDGTSGIAFGDGSIVELRQPAITIQRVYDALTDGTDELNIGGLVTAGDIDPSAERGADIGSATLPFQYVNAEKYFLFPSNAGSQPLRFHTIEGVVSGSSFGNLVDIIVQNGSKVDQVPIRARAAGSAANATSLPRVDFGGSLQTVGFQGNTIGTYTGTGATTINWAITGNVQSFTFGAFNETFTFDDPEVPGYCMLSLTQDATGSRTVTWPASVKWAGGTAPTLSTGSGAVDLIVFMFTGSSYLGFSYLNYS